MGSLSVANSSSSQIFFMPTSAFCCSLYNRLWHFRIGFIFPNPALYDNAILNAAVCNARSCTILPCALFQNPVVCLSLLGCSLGPVHIVLHYSLSYPF